MNNSKFSPTFIRCGDTREDFVSRFENREVDGLELWNTALDVEELFNCLFYGVYKYE